MKKRIGMIAWIWLLVFVLNACANKQDHLEESVTVESSTTETAVPTSVSSSVPAYLEPTGEGPIGRDGTIIVQSIFHNDALYKRSGLTMDDAHLPTTIEYVGEIQNVDNRDWPDEELESTNLRAGMEVYVNSISSSVLYIKINDNVWYEFRSTMP